jgi:ABC-type transport system involved in multi-copper enzyme maturation permease subunit
MFGLLTKTLREVWLGTLLVAAGLFGVNVLLTVLVPKLQEGIGDVFDKLPFAETIMRALVGTETGDQMAAHAIEAILWVHPIVLALLWFHAISFSTRVPAGEIDRGTIDFLLGLPIGRRQLYWSEVLVWLVTGIVLLACGFAGHRIASPAMPVVQRPDFGTSLMIMTNLYCVYLAVGGVGFFVSSLSSHRSRAIAVVFALVLGSFLLNFAAQLWEAAERFAFLGILEYYRPAVVMHTGEFPTSDVLVLLSIAVVSLMVGNEVMARRNICTV